MIGSQDVSVVICTYDEKRWNGLVRAVSSVVNTSAANGASGPGEVIVVADHNPGLQGRVEDEVDGVRTVPNTGRQGLASARNCGIAAACRPVVAFLDDDAVADPDWVPALVGPYRDPAVLGVGGKILPAWEEGRRPRWWPEEFDWVVGCTYRGMPDRRHPVRNLIGANMSFRKDVFDEVGAFLPEMGRLGTRPVGCEETEFCIRVRQRWPECQIVYDPAAVVHHDVPRARASWSYFRRRCFAEGQSKAQVADARGAGDALSTERSYVARTLPRGMARGIKDAVVDREFEALGRTGSIAAGVVVAAAGYAGEALRKGKA
ncbi:MAG: glycosyltransferase family 2 protein [Acidimicrobiales bacterium]